MPWKNAVVETPPPYPKKFNGVSAARSPHYVPKYKPPRDNTAWKYIFAVLCVIFSGTLVIRLLLHVDYRTEFSATTTWFVFFFCIITYLSYKVIAQKDKMTRQNRQLSLLYRQMDGIDPVQQ